jgi:hypothetical protein
MTRKQQRKMNGGGLFDFLGFKKEEDINPDERTKRLKELETKPPSELAQMVLNLEKKNKELKNTAVPVPPTQNPLVPPPPVPPPSTTGGRRRRQRKTRKSRK